METLRPLLPLLAIPLILLIVWPLARLSGRAQAQRMHRLGDDLRHGRRKGFYVIAAVVVMLIVTKIDYLLRG